MPPKNSVTILPISYIHNKAQILEIIKLLSCFSFFRFNHITNTV